MLTHLALAVGLVAISAEPSVSTAPRQLPSAFQSSASDAPEMHADAGAAEDCERPANTTYHGYDGWSNHQFYGPQNFRLHFLISPHDMHQRMMYWNKERGYYYFRPYHPVQVIKQGERAVTWGGTRANPYDNRFLDKVHAEWLADYKIREKAEKVEDLPVVPGEKPDEVMPDEPKVEDVTPPEEKPVVPPPPAPRPRTPSGASKSESKKIVKLGGFSKP